ncbi:MAG: hypothetical protein U0795_13435 [Pirellulales bacterium]
MAWLIGTDEAGYGPKLGPLVVAMTAWELSDSVTDTVTDGDLFDRLSDGVTRSGVTRSGVSSRTQTGRRLRRDGGDESEVVRLTIDDSKRLYQSGGSLAALETGVLTALSLLGKSATHWRQLFTELAPDDADRLWDEPWFSDYQASLPVDAAEGAIEEQAERLSGVLAAQGVRLAAVRARVISPSEFNRRVEATGSKGEVLSQLTLELVRWATEQAGPARCRVVCDKHGGRNHYHGLLQQVLTDEWIQVVSEGRASSTYRWGDGHQIEFRVQGEAHLPSGLASMVAKYLREQAMRAWNNHWTRRLPGLRPTAGYPVDAERYLASIAPLLEADRIDRDRVWRSR